MSKIFPRVTRQNPCPMCGKPDWCSFGDRAVKCMRVESNLACPTGGWFHFYDALKSLPQRPFVFPKSKPTPPEINAGEIIARLRDNTSTEDLQALACDLGVSFNALQALHACWSPAQPKQSAAWAFPMYDGEKVSGVRLRSEDGFKWAISGSRQGIFMPDASVDPQPMVFLPEGPTDTAAALSIGLYAFGRPNNMTGAAQIRTAMQAKNIWKAVIVADNDDIKQNGKRPGIEGALRLKSELACSSVIWNPPGNVKDLREFVKRGGTKELILSDVRKKIWTKK